VAALAGAGCHGDAQTFLDEPGGVFLQDGHALFAFVGLFAFSRFLSVFLHDVDLCVRDTFAVWFFSEWFCDFSLIFF
jgi:hypothetical protein